TLTSRFEAIRQLYWDVFSDLVTMNSCQMTKTTPELAPLSPNFRIGGRLTHIRFKVHQALKPDGSLVESGFEPEALQLRSLFVSEKVYRVPILRT
ncbi:hypothetical protein AVEN_31217-1, partial [Araneus ventricosus]